MRLSAISKFSWEMVLKKVTSWAFLAFVGSFAFLVLFIKDWEIKAGTDRLSKMYLSPQSVLDADPDLKLALRRAARVGPNADNRCASIRQGFVISAAGELGLAKPGVKGALGKRPLKTSSA
jgi:hypothetical protein